MITITLAWLTLSIIVFSLGKFISRVLNINDNMGFFECHWLGFIFLIIFLQFYSLLFPISLGAWILVLFFAALGLRAISPRSLYGRVRKHFNYINAFLALIIIITAAYSSGKQIMWGDTYLYHLDMVRFSSEFKVIPGLANLFGNYGFNSSFFLFASLIDTWVFEFRSAHIALGYVGVVVALQWLKTVLDAKDKYIAAFCVLSSPYLFSRLWGVEAASFSSDFAQGLMILLFGYYFLSKIQDSSRLFLIAGVGALAVVFKLNGIIFWGLSIIHLLTYVKRKTKHKILLPLTASLLIISGLLIRNVITTGWLTYPTPIKVLRMDLPWSLQKKEVEGMVEQVRGWARAPGVDTYQEATRASVTQWLPDWLRRKIRTQELKIGLTAFVMAFYSLLYFRGKYPKKVMTMLSVSILSILFVMYSVPEFRFVYIFIWILLACSLIPFLTGSFVTLNKKSGMLIIFIGLAVFFGKIGPNIDYIPCPFCVKKDKSCLPEISESHDIPYVNQDELNAHRGKERQCYFVKKKGIRFRTPGDLGSGFNNSN